MLRSEWNFPICSTAVLFAVLFAAPMIAGWTREIGWMSVPKPRTNSQGFVADCGHKPVTKPEYDKKCGVCGDPIPINDYETNGKFGKNPKFSNFTRGQIIRTVVRVASMGDYSFQFSICRRLPENEKCFVPVPYLIYRTRTVPASPVKMTFVELTVPENLTCDRCVLRFRYFGHTGNQYTVDYGKGQKVNTTKATGVVVSCADISIV